MKLTSDIIPNLTNEQLKELLIEIRSTQRRTDIKSPLLDELIEIESYWYNAFWQVIDNIKLDVGGEILNRIVDGKW